MQITIPSENKLYDKCLCCSPCGPCDPCCNCCSFRPCGPCCSVGNCCKCDRPDCCCDPKRCCCGLCPRCACCDPDRCCCGLCPKCCKGDSCCCFCSCDKCCSCFKCCPCFKCSSCQCFPYRAEILDFNGQLKYYIFNTNKCGCGCKCLRRSSGLDFNICDVNKNLICTIRGRNKKDFGAFFEDSYSYVFNSPQDADPDIKLTLLNSVYALDALCAY